MHFDCASSWKPVVDFACFVGSSFAGARCSVLSYVHFCGRRGTYGDIWRSGTSFCMTGAIPRALFHLRGRRGTLCTLLKHWQAWVKIRGSFGGHFLWQARSDMVIMSCDAPGSFSWQPQYFVDLIKEVPKFKTLLFIVYISSSS